MHAGIIRVGLIPSLGISSHIFFTLPHVFTGLACFLPGTTQFFSDTTCWQANFKEMILSFITISFLKSLIQPSPFIHSFNLDLITMN